MATDDINAAIQGSKILMIGAGGIGCELLKTLVMTGFNNIELIDLDTIDVSNLNRQFLFRKRHVGMSKAKVAREAVLRFRPEASIVAHHANVKDSQFGVDYFSGFNLVLSGLDNLDARRHVNRVCLAAGVPLVESGTTGYNGQVDVHIKGQTECYECTTKPVPKTYPTCTITNTPSKPVHCLVWAKELPFIRLFGDQELDNDLDLRQEGMDEAAAVEERHFFMYRGSPGTKNESTSGYARRIFDRIFGDNIARSLEMEDLWKSRRKPTPLYSSEVLGEEGASASRDGSGGCGSAVLGLKDPQSTWSLEDNARVFLKAVQLFVETRSSEIGSLSFDKDDHLAVDFVTAASNLRSHSFGIPLLSLFEAKGIAGNIIHAIATTNAIVAGLIVLEALKVVGGQKEDCKNVWCNEFAMGRSKYLVMPEDPNKPNPKCYVCSKTPMQVEVNLRETTLGEVMDKLIRKQLGVHSPIVMVGTNLLYETGEDLEREEVAFYQSNLGKKLCELGMVETGSAMLTVEDYQQQFEVTLYLKHRTEFDEEKDPDGMVLLGDLSIINRGAPEGEETVAEEEEEDVVIVTNSLDVNMTGKRKREEEGKESGGAKKVK